MFAAQDMPPTAVARFPTALTLCGHELSVWAEVGIVVGFTAVFFALAVRGFSHTD